MDGHASHTKNLEAIKYARAKGVVLLSFPAHTTHKLQPLDVSFFKPLSLYYIDETEKWLRHNPGRTVTTFQVSMLFEKAYSRAASVGTAANGFLKTGIYPFNKDVFADYEFISTKEENIVDSIASASESQEDPLSPSLNISSPKSSDTQAVQVNSPTSPLIDTIPPKFSYHIEQITPGAKKIAQELRKRSRKAQSSIELTPSPYKTSLGRG